MCGLTRRDLPEESDQEDGEYRQPFGRGWRGRAVASQSIELESLSARCGYAVDHRDSNELSMMTLGRVAIFQCLRFLRARGRRAAVARGALRHRNLGRITAGHVITRPGIRDQRNNSGDHDGQRSGQKASVHRHWQLSPPGKLFLRWPLRRKVTTHCTRGFWSAPSFCRPTRPETPDDPSAARTSDSSSPRPASALPRSARRCSLSG